MSFYLKISKKPKGNYLQIYDSSHVKGEKNNKSTCIQTLGYEDDLRSEKIPDPITYYRKYAKSLTNQKSNEKKERKIKKVSNDELLTNVGVCLPNSIINTLDFKKLLSLKMKQNNRQFNHGELLIDMIDARIIDPKSKYKTYYDVFPKIKDEVKCSLDDVYSCLEDVGAEYDTVINLFNHCLSSYYKFDVRNTLFDCTNFYFEIDKEDDLRKKGPSKENRKEPILGMGLLLDSNAIPITMELYPGNQSEQPMLSKCIEKAKKQGIAINRTIRIADKGLNSAKNIFETLKQKDGYIFSKSLLKLPEIEKKRVDNENGYEYSYDNNGEVIFKHKSWTDKFSYSYTDEDGKKHSFEVKEKRVLFWNKCQYDKKVYEYEKIRSRLNDLILSKAKREEYKNYAPYVKIYGVDKNNEICETTKVEINEEKLNNDIKYAGYMLLVTSETNIPDQDIYNAYHNLWKIEETFRILKTNLDARPVYVRSENKIYGHFLICYLSIVLIRILQQIIFKNEIKYNEIFDFIKAFNIIKVGENNNLNVIKQKDIPTKIKAVLPTFIDNLFVTEKQLNNLRNYKISFK